MNSVCSIWEISNNLWGRNCPLCRSVVTHSGIYSKYNATKSHKLSKLCKLCSNSDIANELEKSHRIWFENGCWHRKCPQCNDIIRHIGKNSKAVASYSHQKLRTCNSCGNKKVYSEQSKQKMREAIVRRVKMYGIHTRNFNPRACDFIDSLNYVFGFRFQHALNGGEVTIAGYFVDGYDKEKNIVFEYDEPIHHTPSHSNQDIQRQNRIVNSIKPTMFVRYDEKTNRLYDSITNINIPTNFTLTL